MAIVSEEAAVRVRDTLYSAFELLATQPGIGHAREDLTDRPVKFWSVYSYLIVYDPASQPLAIVGVLHGARVTARDVGLNRRQRREPALPVVVRVEIVPLDSHGDDHIPTP